MKTVDELVILLQDGCTGERVFLQVPRIGASCFVMKKYGANLITFLDQEIRNI